MQRIHELQKASGTGLKHSGRVGSLITPPTAAASSDELLQKVTVELEEPGSFHVWLDSSQKRAATLKCGELVPYSAEELNMYKATEFTNGRCVHVFRGFQRRGTTIREGPGSLHYGSGEVFEGRWRNNLRHGLGGLYLPSGYSYEGQFRDDEPCGHGVETFPGGERFVGEFLHGRPHGKGVMYYVDNGSRYEGQWEDGEKHGKGVMFYGNGDIFEGVWERGKRTLSGILTVMRSQQGVHQQGGDAATFRGDDVYRSYRSTWDRDQCAFRMVAVDGHVPATPRAPPLESVQSPLGSDLKSFRVVPDLWLQVHPAHFQRIKRAFEAIDISRNGEIPVVQLRSMWDLHANRETLESFEKAATAVGDDNTLELIECLMGLYPHLPPYELRRWTLTDLTLEYLLKLRGTLAEVQHSGGAKQDGFYVVSQGKSAVTKQDIEINKGFVGGVRVTHSMFVRNKILRQSETMTFPQMLAEMFPNVWKEFLLRVEVETIPKFALEGYLRSFFEFDEARIGYLNLEKAKVAQRRYQVALAAGHAGISMPTSVWEERVSQGFMHHQPRWLLGDISITVQLLRQSDRGRTGYVSLAELLRQAFPNVPCLHTKERLVSSMAIGTVKLVGSNGAELDVSLLPAPATCKCCICDFCQGPEFSKPRPFSPYADGAATW